MAERTDLDSLLDGRRKVPWEEWFDGSVWRITLGKDTTTTEVRTFRSQVSRAARLMGMKASVHKESGDTVLLQAVER